MKRVLTPEWIDLLPADDPRIIRSRRDLLRLNRYNRSPALMAQWLRHVTHDTPPHTITDLGSGDGLFCLDVTRALPAHWTGVTVHLLDQRPLLSAATLEEFARRGWNAQIVRADVLTYSDWAIPTGLHVVTTNLFLHHLRADQLRGLFEKLANHTDAFVALEPRRGWPQLLLSRCLGLLGCGVASRHDGPASVRAGFRGCELSALWPTSSAWHVTERDPGPFSHVFTAQRRAATG